MHYQEINFDGIAGPTHNYAGLSYGNLASMENKNRTSNPKKAALQCLEKMKFLMDLGLVQGIIPPHERPHLETLRNIGFNGSDQSILEQAYKQTPEIFFSCCSSSNMWAANAATITSSVDAFDGKVHITPANLPLEFHRSIEHTTTSLILKRIFSDANTFIHHQILPLGPYFSDEGAANHTRFCQNYEQNGTHLFVYGKHRFKTSTQEFQKYPARQSFEASQAIVRQHGINPGNVIFAQQNPQAINAGVFHNDVISVGNCNLFLFHEMAFIDTLSIINTIQQKFPSLIPILIKNEEISLEEAVKSYIFNSQIVSINRNEMHMIAPFECNDNFNVKNVLNRIVEDSSNPIKKIHFIDLKESMQNGGGPACLRLRVVLGNEELKKINQQVLLNRELYIKIRSWIEKHYRDYLTSQDLIDPELLNESRTALDELTKILKLGSIYSFQTK